MAKIRIIVKNAVPCPDYPCRSSALSVWGGGRQDGSDARENSVKTRSRARHMSAKIPRVARGSERGESAGQTKSIAQSQIRSQKSEKKTAVRYPARNLPPKEVRNVYIDPAEPWRNTHLPTSALVRL